MIEAKSPGRNQHVYSIDYYVALACNFLEFEFFSFVHNFLLPLWLLYWM